MRTSHTFYRGGLFGFYALYKTNNSIELQLSSAYTVGVKFSALFYPLRP